MRNETLSRLVQLHISVLIIAILIVVTASESRASPSGIGFYSPSSPPAGIKSFEPLIAKWWDFRGNSPAKYTSNWPICLKADVVVGNRSVVFLGDQAAAPMGGANKNAMQQACQMSGSQLLYLSVYEGECSQGENGGQSIPQLLNCAQDSNKVIKLMKVTVDGVDVSPNIVRESTSQPYVYSIRSPDNVFAIKPPCCGLAMDESYELFFKPLPIGDHMITAEVIRFPLQNQPVEHDLVKWDIKVVP